MSTMDELHGSWQDRVEENARKKRAECVIPTDTQALIEKVCDEIMQLLIKKNRDYGNSAIEPVRIFSSVNAIEQINVRIDDKISRIRTMGADTGVEDTELDLIGYLILKRVALQLASG